MSRDVYGVSDEEEAPGAFAPLCVNLCELKVVVVCNVMEGYASNDVFADEFQVRKPRAEVAGH